MSTEKPSATAEQAPPEVTPAAAAPAEVATGTTTAEPSTVEATQTEATPAGAEASGTAVAEDSEVVEQFDGSGPPGNGSSLQEPEFNVEVKLADLQADPNNPLFSAQSFEQLNL